jgi:hypothetical protein
MKTIRRFFICLVALLGVAQSAMATEYVTDVILIGSGSSAGKVKQQYVDQGWIDTNYNLNKGCGDEAATPGPMATFTVTMVNPKASGNLQCLYPASMAMDGTDADLVSLYTEQDGTQDTFNKKFHLALYKGYLTAEGRVPSSIELVNRLAICKFTLKDGHNDITAEVSKFAIKNGDNSYTLTTASVSPIWVGIIPVEEGDIIVYAAKGDELFKGTIPGTLKAGMPRDIVVNVTKVKGASATDIDSADGFEFEDDGLGDDDKDRARKN